MIPLEKLLTKIKKILEEQKIQYFLFGSVAASIWGEQRYTKDVDFIVLVKEDDFDRLVQILKSAGLEVGQNPEEKIRRSRLLRVNGYGALADLVLGETEFDESALARTKEVEILGEKVCIASPEDLILYKLIANRPIDSKDIEGIIIRQGEKLDIAYIHKWAKWLTDMTGLSHIQKNLNKLLTLN